MPLTRSKTRRLPGFRFEAQSPPLDEKLPRMDVAVFVGFASSGPIDVPVAVESASQFAAVFGEDAPLVWNNEKSETVFAHLGSAVRAFFRNGGIRCWVIRVARRKATATKPLNQARYNFFPLPNLLLARFDNQENFSSVAPAFAKARSEGSWSDALCVATVLISRPLQINRITKLEAKTIRFESRLFQSDDLRTGEFLRLTFKEKTTQKTFLLFCVVKKIELTSGKKVFQVECDKLIWLDANTKDNLPDNAAGVKARMWTLEKAFSNSTNNPAEVFWKEINATLHGKNSSHDSQEAVIDLKNVAQEDAPAAGSLIGVPSRHLWLSVQSLSLSENKEEQSKNVRVAGQGFFFPQNAPISETDLNNYSLSAERLSFEFWLKKENEYALSLSDLAFDSRHERFWGKLPTDENYFRAITEDPTKTPANIWQTSREQTRFPLSGNEKEKGLFIPLAMTALPDNYLAPIRLQGTTLERDGLAEFDTSLFLDDELKEVGMGDLMNSAEYIRFLSDKPRALKGIHAALSIEEATLISVPDAVHRGWIKTEPKPALPPPPSPFPLRPEWWSFLDCSEREKKIEAVEEPAWENFLSCSVQTVPAPAELTLITLEPRSVFTLTWKSNLTDAKFVLEEAGVESFTDAIKIYEGKEKLFTIYGKPQGSYFYRVRAEVGNNFSNWSNGIVINVLPQSNWQVSEKYQPDVLLDVQRSLLKMCAARGDLFAVMSLPRHYREDQAIEHISLLKNAIGAGEAKAFSYGAVYHPWLIARESDAIKNALTTMPPCGAACGVIAKRTLKRGAWIAPANETLRDVLALTPRISPERRTDIQDAQINLVRQEPSGFMVLNEDTLSDEEDLLQINVRRLLMLLRRLALREGMKYVFEPNDGKLQRLVERNFSAFLNQMLERGAFAGKNAATSYQVVVGESVNNARSVEQGRFIVELRVAPSQPLRFMTMRLVQKGGRGFVTEG
jgi:hypothetical protein